MNKKMNFMLAILWLTCVIIDIVECVKGGQPSWLSLILAHVCLVMDNIDLGLKS